MLYISHAHFYHLAEISSLGSIIELTNNRFPICYILKPRRNDIPYIIHK